MSAVFVTTEDNPYDFFEEFDNWYEFDTSKGYDTLNYVARIAQTDSDMSEKEYEDAVEQAVNDIVRLNITGNYIKIRQKETK